ncbi:MAG: phage tail protein [Oscillospiraceae bacterium]|nr:phage tail protein [Oscillospiraceae bacterium]
MTPITFYDRNWRRVGQRDDAVEFLHYTDQFSVSAVFPRRDDFPISGGMIMMWLDVDDAWQAYEIISTEADVYGDTDTIVASDVAMTELDDQWPSVSVSGKTLQQAATTVLSSSGWSVGILPSAMTTDATRKNKWRVQVNSRLNLRAGPGTSYKSLGLYKAGTIVTEISSTTGWKQVQTPDNRTGWMSAQYLVSAGTVTEDDPTSVTIDPEAGPMSAWGYLLEVANQSQVIIRTRVTVTAGSISGRYIDFDAIDAEYHGVRLDCNTNVSQAGVRYDYTQLKTALIGLGQDDMDFSSVTWTATDDHPAKPAGQKWLEDPAATAAYGRNGQKRLGLVRFPEVTNATELLQKTWEQLKIMSAPAVTIEASVAELYELGYSGQPMCCYDKCYVILEPIGLRMEARIVHLVRDLVRPEMTTPTIGTVDTQDIVLDVVSNATRTQSIQDWQIVRVSGEKLSEHSIPEAAYGFASIGTAAIQQAAITYALLAEATIGQLSSDAITAITARINSITAQTIDTDTLVASYAHLFDVAANQIQAGSVTTDTLAAVMADLITIQAAVGEFDFATVQNLVSQALVLDQGVAGSVYISNLASQNGSFVNATVSHLVLKSSDGYYYDVVVEDDGTIHTAQTEVTAAEIAAGETADGKGIVETTANIADLNSQNIRAVTGVFDTILAAALTAEKITAQEALIASATVPDFYTTAITAIGATLDLSANETINFVVGQLDGIRETADDANEVAQTVSRWMSFDAETGLTQSMPGSIYSTLVDDVGFHILQNGEKIASFYKRKITTEEYRVGPLTASPAMVIRRAGDGGLIIVPEDNA